MKKEEKLEKVSTGQGNDSTTGCLLDYPYFTENYMTIAIDLSEPQTLDINRKAIQQIYFTVNLERSGNTLVFSI